MMNNKLSILFAVPILFILAACGNGEDSLLNDVGHENVPEEDAEIDTSEQNGETDESSTEAFDVGSVEKEIVLDTSEFTDQDLFMYQGINENGAFTAMDDMATTRGIAYDGDLEYAINQSADIAYYSDSEFLEIHSVDDEGYIENVADANFINITYNLDDMNDLVMIEENQTD